MYRPFVSSVVFALVAPWLLAYEFLRTSSWRHRRWLITLFFTFAGSVVLLEFGDGLDQQRHVEMSYSGMPLSVFVNDLWRILTFQLTVSNTKDAFLHVLGYFVGSLLGMPRLFFPIVATIYGYFFGGAVLAVLKNFRFAKENYVVVAFVVIFLFVRGLEGFYTVRTWTGMWILVYSCLKYYDTHEKRYLVLMFVPPFIHIGFFLLAIPAWVVLVMGVRPLIYTGVFVASSVTTFFPVQETINVLVTTERGASQVRSYFVDEQKDSMQQLTQFRAETNWYNAYRKAGLQRWAPTVLVYVLILSGVFTRVMSVYQQRIFSIGLLTLAFSNATWFLYAVHNRSFTIAVVFLLAGFLLARLDPRTSRAFRGLPEYYRWGLHLSILLFFPLILFHVSMTFDWMSVFMFGMPFLVWWDPEINMSIKEFLRFLLG